MEFSIEPLGVMSHLSQLEISMLSSSAQSSLHDLYRRCSFAVLSSGSLSGMNNYNDFDIKIVPMQRGVKIVLVNPPESVFVDGKIINVIREHLFAVLRDVLYLSEYKVSNDLNSLLSDYTYVTNQVFCILRHASVLDVKKDPNLVVCWGGHSINDEEYNYTKRIGYELGLRGIDICTGCGPGAMKGPMKGASIGHAKQRITASRFIGLTEPSIISAEPPNQIVNQLVIMPDIEKRLEAFLRLAHGVIIFPGGVGTTEELLYILGVLLSSKNKLEPMSIVLTGPESSRDYFNLLDNFVFDILGEKARSLYKIVIEDPEEVATIMSSSLEKTKIYRFNNNDSYNYNWRLYIDPRFQKPFYPTHANMENVFLNSNSDVADLAVSLRKIFSGIVAGNVKHDIREMVLSKGVFNLHGDANIMSNIDLLLNSFIQQGRMKLPGFEYKPCYNISNIESV